MISIEEFCSRHKACAGGREWALANCQDMTDAWQKLSPHWLIWVATRPGVLTDQELRLLEVFRSRQIEHLLNDQRSIDAIDITEKLAKGKSTSEELAAATATARARAATWDAALAARANWLRTNAKPNFNAEVQS